MNAAAAAPLAAVSVPDIYRQLDGTDAETFLREGNFPLAARHLAFDVFSRSFFAPPSEMSAAELATMFHIYFLGSSEGLAFDVPDTGFDVALWNPLGAYLAGRGAQIRTGTEVTAVEPGGPRRFRVHTGDGSLDADAVVLATDVRGLRGIVGQSPGLADPAWRAAVGALRSAPPFLVRRLWLDRPPPRPVRGSWPPAAWTRSTTSASWTASTARPRTGAVITVARWWNCMPTLPAVTPAPRPARNCLAR